MEHTISHRSRSAWTKTTMDQVISATRRTHTQLIRNGFLCAMLANYMQSVLRRVEMRTFKLRDCVVSKRSVSNRIDCLKLAVCSGWLNINIINNIMNKSTHIFAEMVFWATALHIHFVSHSITINSRRLFDFLWRMNGIHSLTYRLHYAIELNFFACWISFGEYCVETFFFPFLLSKLFSSSHATANFHCSEAKKKTPNAISYRNSSSVAGKRINSSRVPLA